MESACSLEHIQTGTQIKVICIAEEYLSLYILLKVPVIYAFYRAYSAYRHENGSLDLTVVCRDDTAAGR